MRASAIRALTCLVFATISTAQAASLQVVSVGIEVEAPGSGATLTLRNESSYPLNAQIRIFRWTQEAGEEMLTPTDAVVPSPPMAMLEPGTNYTVRLVRLTKEPLLEGGSYRLLVDELPAPNTQRNRSVKLVIRYSIPVFFYGKDTTDRVKRR